MKVILILFLGATALAVLSGCATDEPSVVTETTTEETTVRHPAPSATSTQVIRNY